MGKYDGILIVSDWDGTLSHGGEVTEENQRAIRYFQSEGGKFTMCSGRSNTHFDKFRDVVEANAPICAYNGALIIDTDGRVIRESFIGTDVLLTACELLKSGYFTGFITYTKEDGAPTKCEAEDFIKKLSKYEKMHHYKLVLAAKSDELALKGKELAERILPEGYVAARSSSLGLEILSTAATKDKALAFLKSYTGATLAVAVGDYENDADMLRTADIGYAVENAVPSVKEVADRITVSVEDSAIARIIEELGN